MGLFDKFRKKEEKEPEEKEPKPKARYEIPPLYKPIYWLVLVIVGVIFINFIFFGFGRAGGMSYLWLKFMDGLIHFVFVSGFIWLIIGFVVGFIIPKPTFEYKCDDGTSGWRLVLKEPKKGAIYEFSSFLHKPIRIHESDVQITRHLLFIRHYTTKQQMHWEDKGDFIYLTTSKLLVEEADMDKKRLQKLEKELAYKDRKILELVELIGKERKEVVEVKKS